MNTNINFILEKKKYYDNILNEEKEYYHNAKSNSKIIEEKIEKNNYLIFLIENYLDNILQEKKGEKNA